MGIEVYENTTKKIIDINGRVTYCDDISSVFVDNGEVHVFGHYRFYGQKNIDSEEKINKKTSWFRFKEYFPRRLLYSSTIKFRLSGRCE